MFDEKTEDTINEIAEVMKNSFQDSDLKERLSDTFKYECMRFIPKNRQSNKDDIDIIEGYSSDYLDVIFENLENFLLDQVSDQANSVAEEYYDWLKEQEEDDMENEQNESTYFGITVIASHKGKTIALSDDVLLVGSPNDVIKTKGSLMVTKDIFFELREKVLTKLSKGV